MDRESGDVQPVAVGIDTGSKKEALFVLAYWALEKLHIKLMTLIKSLKKIVQKRINMSEIDYFCDGCLSVEDREAFLIAVNGKLAKD